MALELFDTFDHQVLSTNGGGFWNFLTTAGFTFDATIVRTAGGTSLKAVSGASAGELQTKLLTGTQVRSGQVAIYLPSLPSVKGQIVQVKTSTDANNGVFYVSATGVLSGRANLADAASEVSSMTLATGQWYIINFSLDAGATHVLAWKIWDDVAGSWSTEYTSSSVTTAGTVQGLNLENPASLTRTIYFDDIALGQAADYPYVAPKYGVWLSPGSDGTDATPADFTKTPSGTATYLLMDDLPFPTGTSPTTDIVTQSVSAVGAYLEMLTAQTTITDTVNSVFACLAYGGASATANKGSTVVRTSDGFETAVWGTSTLGADMSETTVFYKTSYVTPPAAGWSQTEVNALLWRIGHSTDVSPVPTWQALGLQVVFDTPVSGATFVSGSDSGAGVESSSLVAFPPGADLGSGVDSSFLNYLSAAFDAGSGLDTSLLTTIPTGLDSGSGVDTGTLIQLLAGNDSGSGVDASTLIVNLVLTDNSSGSDASSLIVILVGSDSGSGSETATYTYILAPVSDSGSGVDTATVTLLLAVTDTGAGSDASALIAALAGSSAGSGADSGALAALLSGSDTGAGVETSLLTATISVTDVNGVTTESATVALFLAVADTGSGAQTATLVALVPGTDTGVGSDSSALLALLSGLDSGAGVDASALRVFETSADVGSGADVGALIQLLTSSDSGIGTDKVSAFGIASNDVGSGFESSLLTASISQSDAAAGTDMGAMFSYLFGSDLGSGVEIARLGTGVLLAAIITGRIAQGSQGEVIS